jgi:hypothetical protein
MSAVRIEGYKLHDKQSTAIKTFQMYQELKLRNKVVGRVRGLLYGVIFHIWIETEHKKNGVTVIDTNLGDKPIVLPRLEYYQKYGVKLQNAAINGIFISAYNEENDKDDINLLRPYKKPGCSFFITKEYEYLIYCVETIKGKKQTVIKREKVKKPYSLF